MAFVKVILEVYVVIMFQDHSLSLIMLKMLIINLLQVVMTIIIFNVLNIRRYYQNVLNA